MGDCISRQAVLDTLDTSDRFMDEERTVENYKALLKECYEVLPSVTPKQKMGHWIDDTSLGYHISICSNCDWRGHGDTCLIYKPKFCPNCGARMKGGSND